MGRTFSCLFTRVRRSAVRPKPLRGVELPEEQRPPRGRALPGVHFAPSFRKSLKSRRCLRREVNPPRAHMSNKVGPTCDKNVESTKNVHRHYFYSVAGALNFFLVAELELPRE